MQEQWIFASQIAQYVRTACPKCETGVMHEAISHDGLLGTWTVLRCTQLDSCGFTIEIYRDPGTTDVHLHSTPEGIPRTL